MHARSLSALLGLALLSASILLGQTASTSTSNLPMPKDPKELLALARQVNGLSSETKPWHVKYSYQTFDTDGKPANQGTFEEWWAAPDKYKREWVSTHFNQTEYHNPKGFFRTGDQDAPPAAELTLIDRILTPIPPESDLKGRTIQHRDSPYPHARLACVELAGHLFNVRQ